MGKTKFYVQALDDFPFSMYYDRIIENRKKNNYPYGFDPRNNASYLTLMCAKYTMMQMAVLNDPFKSTHFAWINICISRMGLRNAEYLNRALSEYRDKFSTLYIDYIPRETVQNIPEYYRRGGLCTMCSGFFTGSKYYMYRVAGLIEKKFVDTVEAGYGHADEQLYSAVFFDHPELFQHYYGDYQQMIVNYTKIYQNPYTTINHLIPNALGHAQKTNSKESYEVAYKAAKWVFESSIGPRAVIYLQPHSLVRAIDQYFTAAWALGKKSECEELVKYISQMVRDPKICATIRQTGAYLLRKTDVVYDGLVHNAYLDLVTDAEIETIRAAKPGSRIIVYGNYPITDRSFITSPDGVTIRPKLSLS